MKIAIILGLLCLVSAVAAAPADRQRDRATLIADEKAWGQAFVTGNVATVRRLLTQDFRGVEPDGSIYDKADTINFVKALPHGKSDRVDQINIRFYGDAAVVQAHEHIVGPPPTSRSSERVFTDTWIKRGNIWQIVAAEDTLLQKK